MPREIPHVDTLQRYVRGVIGRADHHATNVNEIVLAIAGAVVWRKDAAPLEVFERRGEMKNVLWVEIGGQRFAVSYHRDSDAIQVREGSTHGRVLASFTNTTPVGDVKTFFAGI